MLISGYFSSISTKRPPSFLASASPVSDKKRPSQRSVGKVQHKRSQLPSVLPVILFAWLVVAGHGPRLLRLKIGPATDSSKGNMDPDGGFGKFFCEIGQNWLNFPVLLNLRYELSLGSYRCLRRTFSICNWASNSRSPSRDARSIASWRSREAERRCRRTT